MKYYHEVIYCSPDDVADRLRQLDTEAAYQNPGTAWRVVAVVSPPAGHNNCVIILESP